MRLHLVLLVLLASSALAIPQIVRSFDAPDTGVNGLACTTTELYAVAQGSHILYKLDPYTGGVISSTVLAITNPNGLGMAGGELFVSNGTSTVYAYNTSGVLQNSYGVFCSG